MPLNPTNEAGAGCRAVEAQYAVSSAKFFVKVLRAFPASMSPVLPLLERRDVFAALFGDDVKALLGGEFFHLIHHQPQPDDEDQV